MTSKAKSKSKKIEKAKAGKKAKSNVSKKAIRNFCITLVAVIVLIVLVSIILFIRKKEADRTVKVAFCGIPQEVTTFIEGQIPKSDDYNVVCSYLNKDDVDLKTVSEKFDLFFTWNGEISDTLSKFSEDLPSKIIQTIPTSLRSKKTYPLALDHFELAYFQPVFDKNGLEEPGSWKEFEEYLKESSKHVFTPFFCQGSDDRTLLAFIACIVESRGGLSAYEKLMELLKKSGSLEEKMDVELGQCEDGALTIRLILDMLKNWAQEGYVHPLWYLGTRNDVLYFMEDKQVAVLFESLTDHRSVPYSIIRDYTSMRFPLDSYAKEHCLISPAIVAMSLSNNMNNDDLLLPFANDEVQSRFSMLTKLGPTHSRAESYDRQADDVRFWAASCKGGPVPDPALAVYQRKPEQMKELAAEIRTYLKTK